MVNKKTKSYSDAVKNAASNLLIANEDEIEPKEPPRIKPTPWDSEKWDGLTEEEAFLESPTEVLLDRGECIASQTWSGGSWSSVYEYNGLFYSLDEVELNEFDNAKAAFIGAGIGRDWFDEIDETWVKKEYQHLLDNLWSKK